MSILRKGDFYATEDLIYLMCMNDVAKVGTKILELIDLGVLKVKYGYRDKREFKIDELFDEPQEKERKSIFKIECEFYEVQEQIYIVKN